MDGVEVFFLISFKFLKLALPWPWQKKLSFLFRGNVFYQFSEKYFVENLYLANAVPIVYLNITIINYFKLLDKKFHKESPWKMLLCDRNGGPSRPPRLHFGDSQIMTMPIRIAWKCWVFVNTPK